MSSASARARRFEQVLPMRLWHKQSVTRLDGKEIHEHDQLIVFVDAMRWRGSCNDLTKDAIRLE